MGGPLSVTLTDIYIIRKENDVFKPLKPVIYKRYVDDIHSRCKKNCTDQLCHELSNYKSAKLRAFRTFAPTRLTHN